MRCFNLNDFDREGYTMWPSLLTSEQLAELLSLLEANIAEDPTRGGVRDVMDAIPALKTVASSEEVRLPVEAVLGPDAFLVRATLFDKTEDANWKVPWHQDVTIAVSERRDTEGYGPWSIKAGVQHVQPPASVLRNMVTVRIHLDPCPATNGALRVMPGTHQLGRLDQNLVSNFVQEDLAITCEAEAGDALIMRPLLLHASSASQFPAHRRVLHFDFAIGELANGLVWRMYQMSLA